MTRSVVVKITADTSEFKKQVNALRSWAISLNKESIKTTSRLASIYKEQNKRLKKNLEAQKEALKVSKKEVEEGSKRNKNAKEESFIWAKTVAAMKSAVVLGKQIGRVALSTAMFGTGIANAAMRSGASVKSIAEARRFAIGFGLTGEEGMAQAEGIKSSQRQFKIGQGGALYHAAAAYGMGMEGLQDADAIDVIEHFARNAIAKGMGRDQSIAMAEMGGINPEMMMRAIDAINAGTYDQYESGVRAEASVDAERARKSIETTIAYNKAVEDLKGALIDLLPSVTSAIKWFSELGDGTKKVLALFVWFAPATISLVASLISLGIAIAPFVVALGAAAIAAAPMIIAFGAVAAAAYGVGHVLGQLTAWAVNLFSTSGASGKTRDAASQRLRENGIDEGTNTQIWDALKDNDFAKIRQLINNNNINNNSKTVINVNTSSNASPLSTAWAIQDKQNLFLRGAQ